MYIYPASPSTISARFHPISIAGAFVLPAMIVGKALASITRRLASQCTRSRASTTNPPASAPIRFAGEAFAARAYSTVHGAWQSGRMIATELADAISSGKRPA